MESRDYTVTKKIDRHCDEHGSRFRPGDDLNHSIARSCGL